LLHPHAMANNRIRNLRRQKCLLAFWHMAVNFLLFKQLKSIVIIGLSDRWYATLH